MANALGSGQASRLYQTLVKDKELAVNVFTEVEDHRGPSTFDIAIMVRPGKDLKEVEKAVYAEIERLKTDPIADLGTSRKYGWLNRRPDGAASCKARCSSAYLIGEMAVFYNDPNLINTRFSKIQNVSKEDIERVAKTYLLESNRTVVTTLPKPKPEVAAKAAN